MSSHFALGHEELAKSCCRKYVLKRASPDGPRNTIGRIFRDKNILLIRGSHHFAFAVLIPRRCSADAMMSQSQREGRSTRDANSGPHSVHECVDFKQAGFALQPFQNVLCNVLSSDVCFCFSVIIRLLPLMTSYMNSGAESPSLPSKMYTGVILHQDRFCLHTKTCPRIRLACAYACAMLCDK